MRRGRHDGHVNQTHEQTLPPDWQQRPTAIATAATDTYVLARANIVGHEPYDLPALHEGLRGIQQRLHRPVLPHEPTPDPPQPNPEYQQAVTRFVAALETAADHQQAHTQLDQQYRAELVELAKAAQPLTES